MNSSDKFKSVIRQRSGSCYMTVPPSVLKMCSLKSGDVVRIAKERGNKFSVEKDESSLETLSETLSEIEQKGRNVLIERSIKAVQAAYDKVGGEVAIKVTLSADGESATVGFEINGKYHDAKSLNSEYEKFIDMFGVESLPAKKVKIVKGKAEALDAN